MSNKLLFKCENNHTWLASPKDLVYSKSWCPFCSKFNRKKKYCIEDCMDFAGKRKGKCLSTKYINCIEYMQWECKYGHKWFAPFYRLKNLGHWCPDCAKCRKYTIEEAKDLAICMGGVCLSEKYINAHEYLIWKCEKGHIWKAKFYLVKNLNNWCRKCSGSQKHTIEDMISFAKNKNGKCLSLEYKNNKTKLLWQCEFNHQWSAKFNDLQANKSWCPVCRIWKTQQHLYELICDVVGKDKCFLNYRGFDWLRIPDTGYKMEIDIYVKNYNGKNIAIEYHGQQHYRPIEWFGGKKSFKRVKFRDKIKKQLIENSNEIDKFIIFNNSEKLSKELVEMRIK